MEDRIMRIVELTDETKNNLLESLLKRSPNSYGQYEKTVNDIIGMSVQEEMRHFLNILRSSIIVK